MYHDTNTYIHCMTYIQGYLHIHANNDTTAMSFPARKDHGTMKHDIELRSGDKMQKRVSGCH